jgi:dTDP-4-dehydrorhamnose reductase
VTEGRLSVVLVTGAAGQLGLALQATAPARWRMRACTSRDLDITRPESITEVLSADPPELVIHTAAYTAVDDAEREPDRAEALNAVGAAHLAEGAHRIGARLIHLSTDFVFDGDRGRPYTPTESPAPLSVYGRTKLAGEREVLKICGAGALVLRTAWLYSAHGRNFVLRMLQLMRERDDVGVVADQVSTPTWARSLAEAIWTAAENRDISGIHHWTDAGVASWYDFAVAIQEEALALGLLARAVRVRPLRSEEYPTAAKRPCYSVLDATATSTALGLERRHWRVNLRTMMRELAYA